MPGVVCVGLSVLDVVHRVPAPPTWGHKHVATATDLMAGGPAANAAVCAARLLGTATLVTGLGGSQAASAVAQELASYGVVVVDLAPPDWQLPVASCVVDDAGERTVVSAGALTTPWALNPDAAAAVRGAGVVLLDGHHPAAAEEALVAAGAAGVPVVLDAGSAKPHAEEWLGRLDVVAGSADYAAGLGLDLAGATEHLLRAGAGAAVMTDGAAPILVRVAGEVGVHAVRPPQVRARDTLGAGDVFHGALASGLASGHGLVAAVELAARVAATRVASVGVRAWLADIAPWST